jgi:diguanylate cyclase (GGDEF)-like protein
VSRLKAIFRFPASAAALALLALALIAPGPVFGADDNQIVDASGILDQTPAGQVLPEGTPGSGALNLDKILPPALGGGADPAPKEGPTNSSPKQATAPKPAPSHRKKKKPVTRGAATQKTRGSAKPVSAFAQRRKAHRAPTTVPLRAFSGPEKPATDSPPAKPANSPASPSLVGRVINHIPAEYRIALIGLALLSALFAGISLRERRRSRRVERQALVDTLTALPNRQAFERRLAKEWRRAERYERDVGVLMLDLDDFKAINDGQGHAAGDRALGEAAMLISGRIRSADLAARWGGDEFVVLCPETNAVGLKVLARSLEDRLKHAGIASSAGYAERESGDLGPADMLARADVSMYARKQRERKRTERRSVTVGDTSASFASLSD